MATQPSAPPGYGLVCVIGDESVLAYFLVDISSARTCLALDQAESRGKPLTGGELDALLDGLVVRSGGKLRLQKGEHVAQTWQLDVLTEAEAT